MEHETKNLQNAGVTRSLLPSFPPFSVAGESFDGLSALKSTLTGAKGKEEGGSLKEGLGVPTNVTSIVGFGVK